MWPHENQTGSRSESESSDVKDTRSRKPFVSRKLVIDRRPAPQYPGGQNQVELAVSLEQSNEQLEEAPQE